MPRLHPVTAAQAPADVQAVYAAVKAKIGMLPNLFATFAHAPSVLNGYLAFSDALSHGVLTAAQREVVGLAVAQANGCQYCLSAHTAMGKRAGLSAEDIAAARVGHAHDARDNGIAVLALRLVETRGHVSDADIAAARAAGLDDARILETVAQVALNVLTNFTNSLAGTEIDFPVVEVTLPARR